jgi:hypothetical protein
VEFTQGQFTLVPATNSVQSLKGMLKKPERPVSIEAMNEAIASQGAKITW